MSTTRCSPGNSSKEITIRWQQGQATAIYIPRKVVTEADLQGNIHQLLPVRLAQPANQKINILGEYSIENDLIIFEPLIPFTRGLTYQVVIKDARVLRIKIPEVNQSDAPELLAIYPSQDTVPYNLLKFYLPFSQPMREGQSLQYITVLKNNQDTVQHVFLDLQPELWNAERNMLTLWLDPGRIKRDLQPNKLLGAPLQRNAVFTLIISEQWHDTQGAKLLKSYSKTFTVSSRDSLSPDPKSWRILAPKAGTRDPVKIDLTESLDYSLLNETIRFVTKERKIISGTLKVGDEEKEINFTPDHPWTAGTYAIQIETRLEDLAGNNLNRLFERELANPQVEESSSGRVELTLTID